MLYYIRNMVCDRCISSVSVIFKETGYVPGKVSLGEVEINDVISYETLAVIKGKLVDNGFEMISDHKSQIIEKIKNIIINIVHYINTSQKENYSTLIENEIGRDYTYLSNLFSSVEGITIEKYVILQKIEKVKELLVYHELTLSEIADRLGYSNVAYLSSQFKKVTGLTPTHFREIKENRRKPLDKLS
jgi:AraC family transcriptional regulator